MAGAMSNPADFKVCGIRLQIVFFFFLAANAFLWAILIFEIPVETAVTLKNKNLLCLEEGGPAQI